MVSVSIAVKKKNMLYGIRMTSAKCDICKKEWRDYNHGWTCMNDDSSMESVLYDDDWHKGDESCNEGRDGEHYCPECYKFDDNDNFVLDRDRKDKYL